MKRGESKDSTQSTENSLSVTSFQWFLICKWKLKVWTWDKELGKRKEYNQNILTNWTYIFKWTCPKKINFYQISKQLFLLHLGWNIYNMFILELFNSQTYNHHCYFIFLRQGQPRLTLNLLCKTYRFRTYMPPSCPSLPNELMRNVANMSKFIVPSFKLFSFLILGMD